VPGLRPGTPPAPLFPFQEAYHVLFRSAYVPALADLGSAFTPPVRPL
jgi:hypothetical protein